MLFDLSVETLAAARPATPTSTRSSAEPTCPAAAPGDAPVARLVDRAVPGRRRPTAVYPELDAARTRQRSARETLAILREAAERARREHAEAAADACARPPPRWPTPAVATEAARPAPPRRGHGPGRRPRRAGRRVEAELEQRQLGASTRASTSCRASTPDRSRCCSTPSATRPRSSSCRPSGPPSWPTSSSASSARSTTSRRGSRPRAAAPPAPSPGSKRPAPSWPRPSRACRSPTCRPTTWPSSRPPTQAVLEARGQGRRAASGAAGSKRARRGPGRRAGDPRPGRLPDLERLRDGRRPAGHRPDGRAAARAGPGRDGRRRGALGHRGRR